MLGRSGVEHDHSVKHKDNTVDDYGGIAVEGIDERGLADLIPCIEIERTRQV